MENKAFGRKNVEVVQEEESKKNQMVGEESYVFLLKCIMTR